MVGERAGCRLMPMYTSPEQLATMDETLAEVTAVLKALADPNRLRILAQLMKGDTCNAELNEALGLAPNLLSHHLRVLSDVSILISRRDRIDARWIYYSIDRDQAARWQQWFGHFLDPSRIQRRPVCGPEGQANEGCQADRLEL